jgi:hypothetical protein
MVYAAVLGRAGFAIWFSVASGFAIAVAVAVHLTMASWLM